eukprot:TRINITY_DN9855_c2_g1_i1.p1 TRINITY_DN9855_c2_g1~~TRINITY_DN9855_c2_g1_i1.p1  ORF type:complete len:241 (+),score=44.32 TRINITY_DN9855_c2_g1_i1:140-862(+)
MDHQQHLANLEQLRNRVFVKGGKLAKMSSPTDEKKKWDYVLTTRHWYKVAPGASEITWDEEFNTVHSVEPDAENPKQFRVWWYSAKSGGEFPKLRNRLLQADSEGERDDWVITFRALLLNYWHEHLEATLIPEPEVYQFHLFVKTPHTECPHLLFLSTHRLRIVQLPTPTQTVPMLETEFSQIAHVVRYAQNPTTFEVHAASGAMSLVTKDSIETLTVIAEINRSTKLATGGLANQVVNP